GAFLPKLMEYFSKVTAFLAIVREFFAVQRSLPLSTTGATAGGQGRQATACAGDDISCVALL
ncbi:MAG: hypothetical protein J1E77_08195, partial [Prevotella sp.]|nr:hypothetical protein [Prevotella sp.]